MGLGLAGTLAVEGRCGSMGRRPAPGPRTSVQGARPSRRPGQPGAHTQRGRRGTGPRRAPARRARPPAQPPPSGKAQHETVGERGRTSRVRPPPIPSSDRAEARSCVPKPQYDRGAAATLARCCLEQKEGLPGSSKASTAGSPPCLRRERRNRGQAAVSMIRASGAWGLPAAARRPCRQTSPRTARASSRAHRPEAATRRDG
jgi:hypothetical protein